MNEMRGKRKVREGVVVSAAMAKTRVVKIQRRFREPRFGKIMTQIKKIYIHDEEGKSRVGDWVRVAETRPLSKLKRWRLTAVLEKNKKSLPPE